MELSTSLSAIVERNEAEPVPVKVGERGYSPYLCSDGDGDGAGNRDPCVASSSTVTLPLGPHPAERHRTSQLFSPPLSPLPQAHINGAPTLNPTAHPNLSSISLSPSTQKRTLKAFTRKFKPSETPNKYLFGASPYTFARLVLQLVLLMGTAVAWALAARRMTDTSSSDSPAIMGGGIIFVHVAFTIITVIQLLFLERCHYRLRAERHILRNPSLPMPASQTRSNVAFAPWHRAPLPTYAAALGYRGTGDVEDGEVARVVAIGRGDVPPLYGNTRGSTLLAYGIGVTPSSRRGSLRSVISSGGRSDRPVSYGQSQELEDALRARRLEHALGSLEGGR